MKNRSACRSGAVVARAVFMSSPYHEPSRCELEMQALQPAQHVRRRILVAAGAGRTVLALRDPDVGQAREESRARLARASARARGAPTHVWMPNPKPRCSRPSARSSRNSAGASNCRGSRLAAPLCNITLVPGGMSTSPIFVATRGKRNSPWIGLSSRSVSSTKLGMRSGSARSCAWRSGRSAISVQRGAEEPRGRLPACREQVGRDQGNVVDVGYRPVGKGRGGETRHHVGARRAPAAPRRRQ